DELRERWREFASRTWLWAIVVQFGFTNAAVTGAEAVLGPAVAKNHLSGAAGWGFVLACQVVGRIIGGLLLLRFQPRRMLLAATLGYLLTTPLLGALAIPTGLLVVAGFALLAGVGGETFGVLWDTTVQQEI